MSLQKPGLPSFLSLPPKLFFKRFTKQSSATVGIMDADQIDLGGKFSDESDSFVGWNSPREEIGIRRGQETDVWARYIYTFSTPTSHPISILNTILLKYPLRGTFKKRKTIARVDSAGR